MEIQMIHRQHCKREKVTMDTFFENKVAVITGAGGVICSAVSKNLAKEGVTVLLVGRTMAKLEKVADEIKADGGKCACYECDVQNQTSVNELADKIIAEYGHVDYLINGAGGNNALAVPNIAQFDPRELDENKPEDLKGLYNVDMNAFERPQSQFSAPVTTLHFLKINSL